MGTKADLQASVTAIFKKVWEVRDGKVVPDDSSVSLGNVGVKIEATILYADLTDSTGLVDRHIPEFAAEIYKSYLHCAATIIRSCGGEIRSYDGDRIMAIFIGMSKNSQATKAALKINYAVTKIINPTILKQYSKVTYQVQQVVGIDTSWVMAAKTGVRSANDLVWIGSAANHAAKLCSLSGFRTFISENVYLLLSDASKYSGTTDMWKLVEEGIYGSNYWWELD